MSAADMWAQMQQAETAYTRNSKKRMENATSRSLASLNPQPAKSKADDPKPLAPVQNQLCMQMPRFSAAPAKTKVRVEQQLDAEVTVALPAAELDRSAALGKVLSSGKEHRHVSIADQYEETLTNTARDLNLLSAEHKSKRLQAVRSLHAKLLEPPLNATVMALTLPHIIKPILKRFEDPVESIRDEAVKLMSQLLHTSADIDQVLPYVLPVTLDRLRAARPTKIIEKHQPSLAPQLPPELQSMEDEEGSEEVRFQLLQMLSLRLIPRLTPIDAMPYLPDITACIVRSCNHTAPQIVKESCNCALALSTALYHEHYKASILKPYTERITLGLMYALYHKQSRVRAVAVRALTMVVLAGESKLVQDLAAWNPPNLLDLTQYYHPRARRNTLAHLAEDQSPIVREAFYDMCHRLLLSVWLASEEDTRLLPYVLSGTYDKLPELAEKCVVIVEGLGKRHEELNEKDFLDIYDYAADQPRPGVEWLAPLNKRPCIGARVLVRSRLNKCLESLCKELLDDNNKDENRIKCAKLLAVHCQYSESGMTGDAHKLVQIALGAGGHPLLHLDLQSSLQNLGHYLEPELYLPLSLPQLRRAGLGHPALARLTASLCTLLNASLTTERAAVAAADKRVGGLAKCSDSTLAEFVAEVSNPAYCRSAHMPLRASLAELLRMIASHPGLASRQKGAAGSGDGLPLAIFIGLAQMRALGGDAGELANGMLASCSAGLDAIVAAVGGAAGRPMAVALLQAWSKVEVLVTRELAHQAALAATARRAAAARAAPTQSAVDSRSYTAVTLLGGDEARPPSASPAAAAATMARFEEDEQPVVVLPAWLGAIKAMLMQVCPDAAPMYFTAAVRIAVQDGSDSEEDSEEEEEEEQQQQQQQQQQTRLPYTPDDFPAADISQFKSAESSRQDLMAAAAENASVEAPASWGQAGFDQKEAAGWFEEKLAAVRYHRQSKAEVVRLYGSEAEFAARLRQTIAASAAAGAAAATVGTVAAAVPAAVCGTDFNRAAVRIAVEEGSTDSDYESDDDCVTPSPEGETHQVYTDFD